MAKRSPTKPVQFNATAIATACASALNASANEAYESGNALVRGEFLKVMPHGSPALVQFVEVLKGALVGFAALNYSVTCANMRRIALGCSDATIAAKVQALLEAGKKPQDVIKEAAVPKVSTAGRKAKDASATPASATPAAAVTVPVDAYSIAVAAYDALSKAERARFLRHAFGAEVARIKDAKARVAAATAVEAIAKALAA